MGQAVDQTRRQVDLTREELEQTREAIALNLHRLEDRVRAELDWRARLRREGPAIAAVLGGVAVLAVGGILLKRRLSPPDRLAPIKGAARDARDRAERTRTSIEDLAADLAELRKELRDRRQGKVKGHEPLWQKLVLAGVTAAAGAGAKAAAARMVDRATEDQTAAR